MRVLYNDKHFDVSNPGPVFFYTGNEGNIEMFTNNTGWWEALRYRQTQYCIDGYHMFGALIASYQNDKQSGLYRQPLLRAAEISDMKLREIPSIF